MSRSGSGRRRPRVAALALLTFWSGLVAWSFGAVAAGAASDVAHVVSAGGNVPVAAAAAPASSTAASVPAPSAPGGAQVAPPAGPGTANQQPTTGGLQHLTTRAKVGAVLGGALLVGVLWAFSQGYGILGGRPRRTRRRPGSPAATDGVTVGDEAQ